MDKFANNLNSLCKAVMPYTWILVVVALLVIGVMLIVPSESTHQRGLKALPWVIVGALLVLGCVYIGEWITNQIAF